MKKILVVDDEPAVLEYLALIAQSLDYEVLKAKDGNAAIRAFSEDNDIDALITDIKMPGMNGYQLAIALREMRPELPILFISGFFKEFETPPAILGEVSIQFLSKPFNAQQFGTALLLLFVSLTPDSNL